MRAIETMYAGTLFRSRLEARWAVLFDELGIEWEFEPQGFVIGLGADEGLGTRYLPDFLLPDLNIWVEVKGSEDALDRNLLSEAIDYGAGLPHVGLDASWSGGVKQVGGLLVLGPVPRPSHTTIPAHPLLQHYKGTVLQWVRFDVGTIIRNENYDEWFGDGASASYTGPLLKPDTHFDIRADEVAAAYSAARSARFEHSHREVWSTTSR